MTIATLANANVRRNVVLPGARNLGSSKNHLDVGENHAACSEGARLAGEVGETLDDSEVRLADYHPQCHGGQRYERKRPYGTVVPAAVTPSRKYDDSGSEDQNGEKQPKGARCRRRTARGSR
jgi:hypothetical protein